MTVNGILRGKRGVIILQTLGVLSGASCADADMSGSGRRSGEPVDTSEGGTPVEHGFDNCPAERPDCVFERPFATPSGGACPSSDELADPGVEVCASSSAMNRCGSGAVVLGDVCFHSSSIEPGLPAQEAAVGRRVAIRDVDDDGSADLVAVFAGDEMYRLGIYWGDGAGGFADFEIVGSWFNDATALTIADVDSDGRLDVLLGGQSSSGNVLLMFFGGTERGFESVVVPVPSVIRSQPIFVADVNGDDREDVLLGGPVALATGARQYELSEMKISDMDLGQVRQVADMDGDGLRDVLGVLTPDGETVGDLYLTSGAADGLERMPVAFPDDFGAGSMGFGDFDDDGVTDVADLHHEPSPSSSDEVLAQLLLRSGLGGTEPAYELLETFALAPLLRSRGHELIGPKIADIDGDADQDLLFAAGSDGLVGSDCVPPESWRVLRFAVGNGDGTFTESPCDPVLSMNGVITDFDSADLNGDGISDVVAVTLTGVELLLSEL